MSEKQNANRSLVAASSIPLVLAILARGESYGYEIIQTVRARSGGALEWNEGMLYPVLHRLERDRLVQSRWGKSESGRRRRYYHITTAGRAALADERSQWNQVHSALESLCEGESSWAL